MSDLPVQLFGYSITDPTPCDIRVILKKTVTAKKAIVFAGIQISAVFQAHTPYFSAESYVVIIRRSRLKKTIPTNCHNISLGWYLKKLTRYSSLYAAWWFAMDFRLLHLFARRFIVKEAYNLFISALQTASSHSGKWIMMREFNLSLGVSPT